MADEKWEYDKTFEDYWSGGDSYSRGTYTPEVGGVVEQASQALQSHINAGAPTYTNNWLTQINDTIGKIQKRDKFSYDVNGDALYQQYKDKYIQQGKMAMQDTMGQAAAMTGGYGNSYAATLGNQAYQAQLNNLNDIIPELYQMAYDRYNQETQDLYNQYSLYADRENTDYGRYRDTVSDWQTDRNYLAGRYDSERNFDYGVWNDTETANQAQWNSDKSFAYSQYIDDYNKAYGEHRDSVADAQWQADYELASAPKVVGGGDTGLTPSEWNEINENASIYAESGKNSLSNYLNGLVNRGWLDGDEAADILDYYFPFEEPEKAPAGGGTTFEQHVMN